MSDDSQRPNPIALLGGVVVGIGVFLGVNITSGWAIIPTPASVQNHGRAPLPRPVYPQVGPPKPSGPVGPYQAVCATCHQPEGQGMPGAFPPLAGSEWLVNNPEVPIRIVLLGLSGAIEVQGKTFNAVMPPPPGLTDEQLAEAITYARTHFGNTASEVKVEQVKQVRAALAGRTAPFTAEELKPLLTAGAVPAAAGSPAPQPGAVEGAAPAGAAAPAPAPAVEPGTK